MSAIVTRIKEYLSCKQIPISIAERECSLANATLSKAIKTEKAIKTDTLERFLKVYNDICPDWILNGKGEMLKAEEEQKAEQKNLAPKDHSSEINLKKVISAQEKTILAQEKTILALEKIIADKNTP